jgi:lactoylglutathione lyase
MSLIDISGVDHVALQVKDLKRSVSFYEKVFGLQVKEDKSDENWIIIGLKDKIYLCLYQITEVNLTSNTIYHWGFHVNPGQSLHEISRELQAQGVSIEYLEDNPDGVVEGKISQSLYVLDPDGYTIELSSVFGGGLA